MLQTTQTVLSCPDKPTNRKAMLTVLARDKYFSYFFQGMINKGKKSFYMIKTRAWTPWNYLGLVEDSNRDWAEKKKWLEVLQDGILRLVYTGVI